MSEDRGDGGSAAELLGAHYCTWLVPENFDGDWTDECVQDPELGNYDARDPAVVERQAELALDHGVNWWWASWWGEDSVADDSVRATLGPDVPDALHVSLLYESNGLLEWEDGEVDFDDPENRRRLREHFSYFAEEFFDEPGYLEIDGRPVVFLYVSRTFTGDVAGALAEAREAADADPYLVGDVVQWEAPTDEEVAALDLYDAVTTYNSYRPREDIDDIDFLDRVFEGYENWAEACEERDVAFIPEVIPGFDDTEVTHVEGRPARPVLSRDPKRFAEMCDRARAFVDDDLLAAFITSWTEWFENTAVEPSESEGTTYLEILDERLAAD